jgi:hemerythrin-like domain-containing protein
MRRPVQAPAQTPSGEDPGATVAIRILEDEHLAIASVLYGMRAAVRRIREGGAPDFRLLRALADYVVAFPERLHHPKESAHLFAALALRCPDARPLVAALEAEHGHGAALIAALVDALTAYAGGGGEKAFARFADAVESYAEFHWRHMRAEEEALLPLARRHLTDEDWARIAAAFRANDNPLAGLGPKAATDALYRRILELAPTLARAAAAPPRGRGRARRADRLAR